MRVVSLTPDHAAFIGNIELRILEIVDGKVHLGVVAPLSIPIVRANIKELRKTEIANGEFTHPLSDSGMQFG